MVRRRASYLSIPLAVFLAATSVATASAQVVRSDWWVANGNVQALALSSTGDTLYLGGEFDRVGPPQGSWIPVDKTTGIAGSSFPIVAGGAIFKVVADGAGGYFLAGTFTHVSGLARNGLARVLSNGTVDSFDPDPDEGAGDIALVGSILYATGGFTNIGGAARNGLAAIDVNTGLATAWDPNPDSNFITELEADASNVYVSGLFNSIGGQARSLLAAVDPVTGLATSWNPNPSSIIQALTLHDTTLYVGGNFTTIAGQSRSKMASFGAPSGVLTDWDPNVSGPSYIITVEDTTVYIGGNFSIVGGESRLGLASIGGPSGVVTSWNPTTIKDPPQEITVDGGLVYIGGQFGFGDFDVVAAIDATTGTVSSWNPLPSDQILSIVIDGPTVWLGGSQTFVGGLERKGLAAIDRVTGLPTSWNPGVDGGVYALAFDGARLFVGGEFDTIAGQPRTSLAEVDPVSGTITSWNPAPFNSDVSRPTDVNVILPSAGELYVGGRFTEIGGLMRDHLASLDPATGNANALDANLQNLGPGRYGVHSLAVDDTLLYVGGEFSSLGGLARQNMGAVHRSTSLANAFDPQSSGRVTSILPNGSTVFASGELFAIGGQSREVVAQLDASTGAATSWDPLLDGAGSSGPALALEPGALYLAGVFSGVNGTPRPALAAVDPSTAALLPWDPGIPQLLGTNAARSALLLDNGWLYCGVRAKAAGPYPQSYVFAFSGLSLVDVPRRIVAEGLRLSVSPNPSTSTIDLRFSLPKSGRAKLDVYDVQGRLIRSLVDSDLDAGPRHVRWDRLDLAGNRVGSGIYLVRLSTESGNVMRRAALIE